MTVTMACTSVVPGSTGVAESFAAENSGIACTPGDSSIRCTAPRLAPASPARVAAFSRASAKAAFSALR